MFSVITQARLPTRSRLPKLLPAALASVVVILQAIQRQRINLLMYPLVSCAVISCLLLSKYQSLSFLSPDSDSADSPKLETSNANPSRGRPSKCFIPNDSSLPYSRGRASSLSLMEQSKKHRSTFSPQRSSDLRRASLSSAALQSSTGPDMDPDRLDKACGLGPCTIAWGTSATAVNTPTKDRISSASDVNEGGYVDIPHGSEEATSDSMDTKKALKYQPYEHPDIRDILRSLSQLLRSHGQKMRDYIEVEEMVEARELERRSDAKRRKNVQNEQPVGGARRLCKNVLSLHPLVGLSIITWSISCFWCPDQGCRSINI